MTGLITHKFSCSAPAGVFGGAVPEMLDPGSGGVVLVLSQAQLILIGIVVFSVIAGLGVMAVSRLRSWGRSRSNGSPPPLTTASNETNTVYEVTSNKESAVSAGTDVLATNKAGRVESDLERNTLDEQLQNAQQIESIGTLAGGIAHDFNNLLMGIQGYTSIMLFNMDKGHPFYEKLMNIEACIQSGAALTKQLLGFAGNRKAEVVPLAMGELVQETLDTFKRTKKKIVVHDSYMEGLWTVKADKGQVEQVLLNLFINSWQSMHENRELYVDVSNVRISGDNHVRKDISSGHYVRILVSNSRNGLSVDPYEAFLLTPSNDMKSGAGSGLGLVSSFGVVRGYDGIVDFKRLSDGGTAYTICFPASEIIASVAENHETLELKGSGTVLFVDDEEMIIEVGKPMLEELGYQVLVARGGKEAVKVYEVNKSKIDLVILDLVMPSIDGGEVFDLLKSINPSVKTLLSSGYSVDERAASILDRGCDGFIQKPFNLKRLSSQIQSVLKKQ